VAQVALARMHRTVSRWPLPACGGTARCARPPAARTTVPVHHPVSAVGRTAAA